MGTNGKTYGAQVVEIGEFPLHIMGRGLVRSVAIAEKEFSHKASMAPLFLINVNLLRCFQGKYPKLGIGGPDTCLRKNVGL